MHPAARRLFIAISRQADPRYESERCSGPTRLRRGNSGFPPAESGHLALRAKALRVSYSGWITRRSSKFVENRFINSRRAPDQNRDAAQPDLLEFFDFTGVPWLTPPMPPTPTALSRGVHPAEHVTFRPQTRFSHLENAFAELTQARRPLPGIPEPSKISIRRSSGELNRDLTNRLFVINKLTAGPMSHVVPRL